MLQVYIVAAPTGVEWWWGCFKVRSKSAATQLRYRCIDCLSTAVQRNALHLMFTFVQYRNTVVGAETEIRPLQLPATQMQ